MNEKNVNASLFLSIFQFFSVANLFRLVSACDAPNPLMFFQQSNHYIFTTSPHIDPDQGNNITWAAYDSLAKQLMAGKAGNITQIKGCYVPTLPNIWSNKLLGVKYMVESNATRAAASEFLKSFTSLVDEDPAFQAAANLQHQKDERKTTIGIAIGLLALLAGIMAAYVLYKRFSRHQGYANIDRENPAVEPRL